MTLNMFKAKLIVLEYEDLTQYGLTIFSKDKTMIFIYNSYDIRISINNIPNKACKFRSYAKTLEYLTND